mgnify:CR=1 FL=1
MAIIKSAKKAIRSSARKQVFNLKRKITMRDLIKNFKKLVAAKKPEEAKKLVPNLYQAIDKAAKRGVIDKKTAARKKSRLIASLKKI